MGAARERKAPWRTGSGGRTCASLTTGEHPSEAEAQAQGVVLAARAQALAHTQEVGWSIKIVKTRASIVLSNKTVCLLGN